MKFYYVGWTACIGSLAGMPALRETQGHRRAGMPAINAWAENPPSYASFSQPRLLKYHSGAIALATIRPIANGYP